MIRTVGTYPSRGSGGSASASFIAEIVLFAGNFAVSGTANCNGALLPINSN